MDDQKISVVVPAYNGEKWIANCIESLLNQTYKNLEIIAVDDGSQDGTLTVLQGFGDQIRLISQENQGVTGARLAGIRAASGDFIGFVDGDDEVEPQMFERLLRNALSYGADISHCANLEIRPDGQVICPHATREIIQEDHIQGLKDLLEDVFVEQSLCTKLYKRRLFEGLEEKMDRSIKNNEDMLMNYYLFSKAESAVYEDVSPYHYLARDGSASRSQPNEHSLFDPMKVREIILGDCPEELKDTAKSAWVRMCLQSFRELCGLKVRQRENEQRIREMLLKHKEYDSALSLKNRLQVLLLRSAPGLYRSLYRGFVGLVGE